MITACIDPFVLACPDPRGDPDEFEAYVYNLRECSGLRDADWVTVTLSEEAFQILYATGSYRELGELHSLFRQAGIKHYQPQDINTLIAGILNQVQYLEQRLGICNVDFDVSIEPSTPLTARPVQFIEHFERLGALLGLGLNSGDSILEHVTVITKNYDVTNVTVKGRIDLCEFSDSALVQSLVFPFLMDLELPVCCNPERLRQVSGKHVHDAIAQLNSGFRIAVFTLHESSARHVRDSLIKRNPQLDIHLCHEKVNTPQVENLAKTSDMVVLVTDAISHAVFDAVQPYVDKPVYPVSRGWSSILRAIEERAHDVVSELSNGIDSGTRT